jgi:YfiH family protein
MAIKSKDSVIIPSINGNNIKAVFTTKHGDPKKENVLEEFVYQNSEKPDLILRRLQSGYPLKQIHSNSIYKFHDWFIGRQGDGMFTSRKFLPCVINVADCVPILIKNRNKNEVCAIHAGWKGLKNGIIKKAVNMFSGPEKELNAWIGPSISQKKYEVSYKFISTFSKVNMGFESCFQSFDDKYFLDLQMVAKLQLLESKLTVIDIVQRCVFEEASSFYSFRREKPKRRMSAIIWIE